MVTNGKKLVCALIADARIICQYVMWALAPSVVNNNTNYSNNNNNDNDNKITIIIIVMIMATTTIMIVIIIAAVAVRLYIKDRCFFIGDVLSLCFITRCRRSKIMSALY